MEPFPFSLHGIWGGGVGGLVRKEKNHAPIPESPRSLAGGGADSSGALCAGAAGSQELCASSSI